MITYITPHYTIYSLQDYTLQFKLNQLFAISCLGKWRNQQHCYQQSLDITRLVFPECQLESSFSGNSRFLGSSAALESHQARVGLEGPLAIKYYTFNTVNNALNILHNTFYTTLHILHILYVTHYTHYTLQQLWRQCYEGSVLVVKCVFLPTCPIEPPTGDCFKLPRHRAWLSTTTSVISYCSIHNIYRQYTQYYTVLHITHYTALLTRWSYN